MSRQQKKRKTVRAWEYEAYFEGRRVLYADPAREEGEVRQYLEEKYRGGNWKTDSLRRGPKVKVRKDAWVL